MYYYNLFSLCWAYLYYNKSAKAWWFTLDFVVVVMDLWVTIGGGECGGVVGLAVVVACRRRERERVSK